MQASTVIGRRGTGTVPVGAGAGAGALAGRAVCAAARAPLFVAQTISLNVSI